MNGYTLLHRYNTEDSAGTPAALNTTLLDPSSKELDLTTASKLTPTVTSVHGKLF